MFRGNFTPYGQFTFNRALPMYYVLLLHTENQIQMPSFVQCSDRDASPKMLALTQQGSI